MWFSEYLKRIFRLFLGTFGKSFYICKRNINKRLMSPVFKRESEYTFKIYSNEEERMHIHVLYENKEAKFWLEPEVELAKNTGIPEHKLSEIRKIVEKNADEFKKQYREHIGMRVDD
jgi:hypothetical protein